MAAAAAGRPTRFLTLTVNPAIGVDAADRLRLLSHSWRLLRKRIMRQYPGEEVEFLAVVEATEAGEPHLHILLRAPFIPQGWISDVMNELMQSPIVDIRRVRGRRQVVAYVAKYIAKQPAQFEGSKRYWSSRAYEVPAGDAERQRDACKVPWLLVKDSPARIIAAWVNEGWLVRRDKRESWIGWPVTAFPDSPVWEYRRQDARSTLRQGESP